MASGVFGLKKVYKKQVENVDNSNLASWPENAEYGYWAGGQKASNSNYESEISRLDFSTETALTYPAMLPVGAEQIASVTTNSYGYFGGGAQPTVQYNVISRLDYSNDSISLPGNNLPVKKHLHAGTNSDTYGYFVGGYQNNVYACVITRLDFSTESISLPGNDMPSLRAAFTAVASNSYSYFGGGTIPSSGPPGTTCLVSRLDFSTETNSLPGKNLPSERWSAATISGKLSGYFTGGQVSTPVFNTISRLDFDTETNSLPGKNLVYAKGRHSTVSNGQFGYIVSGVPPSNSEIQKFDFNNEVVSSTPVTVSAVEWSSGVQGGASLRSFTTKTVGYFMGGYDGGNSSYVKRMDFTSDTSSTPDMRISHATTGMRGVANNNFGYAMGGFHGNGTPPPSTGNNRESRLHRIDFATENLTVFSATPEAHTDYTTLWCVDDMYGWKAGDLFNAPPSPVGTRSDIRRLDYSTESWNVPGQIQPARQARGLIFSDIKNRNGITISGSGYIPTVNYNPTTFIKYQTTNDTLTGTPFPALGGNKNSGSSIYNPQYGYYAGGGSSPGPITAESDVYRLDYSSDTFSDTTANTHANRNGTGVSSNYYGYFCQGAPASPPPFALATITKFDYSTETTSPAPNMNGGGDNNLGSMSNGI